MITLDTAIQSAKDIDDIKVILRQIVSALNTLDDARQYIRSDVKMLSDSTGIVWKATDGNEYKQTVSAVGGIGSIVLTKL
jgi:hypothetical protein